MDKRLSTILLSIVVLILIAANILIYINNHKNEIEESTNNTISIENKIENGIVDTEQEVQDKITNKVATLPEKNRMQIYFGNFITYVEQRNYEKAYKLLNESFKQNYFPTINEFEQYVEKYPKNMTVDYQNIERQGELFILTVEIKDIFDSSVEAINQRVVIRENGTNDYTISFQIEQN